MKLTKPEISTLLFCIQIAVKHMRNIGVPESELVRFKLLAHKLLTQES